MGASESTNGQRQGKYLTFKLGREEYGLELVRVREIIALIEVTPVPLAPDYVRGVMNLRGRVVPVIDLRRRFAMARTEDHDRKCIIVCDVQRNGEATQMGILVDAVSEVLHIGAADIEAAPTFGGEGDTPFIYGIAKAKSGVKILLDIDVVLSYMTLLPYHRHTHPGYVLGKSNWALAKSMALSHPGFNISY